MKIRSTFKARMLCMVALLGTIMALTSCSSEEIAQDDSGKTPKTDKNYATFSSVAPEHPHHHEPHWCVQVGEGRQDLGEGRHRRVEVE